MTVGILTIELGLPSRTLKEKRTIVKSVVERLRQHYNAAVADVADLDNPASATIAAACISNTGQHADAELQRIARTVEEWRLDAEVLSISTELL
jgi:uncharacterized protein YlxP (DUF503 family)